MLCHGRGISWMQAVMQVKLTIFLFYRMPYSLLFRHTGNLAIDLFYYFVYLDNIPTVIDPVFQFTSLHFTGISAFIQPLGLIYYILPKQRKQLTASEYNYFLNK